ncbi:DUF397 domain-containing protein [Actinomadura welshii]
MSNTKASEALSPTDQDHVAWHISTFSDNGGGNCVEAGPLLDSTERVAVRHSRHPEAETNTYTRPEWEAFLG